MKKNIKILIGIIIGIVISVTCTVVAETIIASKEVSYDNAKSGGSYNEVQDSIDELYARAGYTAEKYKEEILHGADPVLGQGMIPVYLAENGDVYYANEHTSWYSYEYKRWANAVILVDSAKDMYKPGNKIKEEDIESYFVWIPRYAYKLWNIDSQEDVIDAKTLTNENYKTSSSNLTTNDRLVEIVFGTLDYLNEQGYKKQTRDLNTGLVSDPAGIKVGDYLIHPGFTLGEKELNGFWIGKFETGYNQSGNGSTAITDIDSWTAERALQTESNSSKVIIKPNVYSWQNINLSNMFKTAKGYSTNLDSHMLKNTEWGAVAYLSHSAYGKGGEVNINSTSDCKTGYSTVPDTIQNSFRGNYAPSTAGLNDKYNSAVGYQASTTGNITGVYDMSGGASEYVAATVIDYNVNLSGTVFEIDTVNEYMKAGFIDVYPSDSTFTSYNKRILGDATGELAPFYSYYEIDGAYHNHSSWYSSNAGFITKNSPCFGRGGSYYAGGLAGLFFFEWYGGAAGASRSFRLALAPML